MTDRPILLNGPMVRAILDGRKTQTRRFLQIQGHKTFSEFGPSDTNGYDWTFRDANMLWHDYRQHDLLARLPHKIGDRLWVREAWCGCGQMDAIKPADFSRGEPIGYLADGEIRTYGCLMVTQGKTRPSIHMPRWASRLTLVVTNVRVQRLQDISEADAIAEGCGPFFDEDNPKTMRGPNGHENSMAPLKGPIDDFQRLWNATYGPEAWDANPWVSAITFETHHCNIDQMGEAS